MRANVHLLNKKYSPTNRRLSTVLVSCLTTLQLLILPLAIMTVAAPPASANDSTDAPTAIIYDNGPLATGTVSRSGVTAPAGAQWSEASYDYGSTTVANTLAGVGCQRIGAATFNRCADDFNVPVGQTWTINQVIVFVYQANAAVNPVVGATLQIWSGIPGAGGTVIGGDTTTNRLATSVDSGMFRIFNSGPPLNTATGTTRRLWQVTINAPAGTVLTAGNYWIDFQVDAGASGNFAPTSTITGTRGVPGWNARQSINGAAFVESFDDGTPATAANIVNDFPFKLDGTISGAPATPASRRVDFNGDNRSDYAIARATGAAAQTTWYILDSAGATTTQNWGLGVGFTGGDVATPEDFDGDGKTDIAVWRGNPGNPNASNFYILQSSSSTLRTEQFGKQGDDPTVIDDYDGDGKADVAVFRTAVGAGDPCGVGAVWYWRPSGTPATNFSYACWGAAGDKAYPGDFDGDLRADFSVVRNNGGPGQVLQNRTTAGIRTVNFGDFTDRYIAGDYDADGRADLAVTRANGAAISWYFTKSGSGQSYSFQLGNSATDYNVPGDYDGDNKTDFGLWRSGAGVGGGSFYLLKTFTSPLFFNFGSSTTNLTAPDYPVAAYQAH